VAPKARAAGAEATLPAGEPAVPVGEAAAPFTGS